LKRESKPVQIHDADQRRIFKIAIWALVLCALPAGVYFFGPGRRESGPNSAANRRARAPGIAQSDNSLPIAPPFVENSTPGDLLARAQVQNELLYTDLQSFVCNEQMDRYQSHLNGDGAHRIDTVDARVSFENGVENYTDIRQNNRERTNLSSIPGAWSEGEFGTLLRQTRALLATQHVSLQTDTELNGTPAALYSIDVSGQDSPWELTVNSRQFRVPFQTRVWVAKTTGRILKIGRASTAMPPTSGISEIEWSVMLKLVDVDGKTWLLPTTGEYSVLYQHSNHREWNMISFSDYHRYTSRSVIHF